MGSTENAEKNIKKVRKTQIKLNLKQFWSESKTLFFLKKNTNLPASKSFGVAQITETTKQQKFLVSKKLDTKKMLFHNQNFSQPTSHTRSTPEKRRAKAQNCAVVAPPLKKKGPLHGCQPSPCRSGPVSGVLGDKRRRMEGRRQPTDSDTAGVGSGCCWAQAHPSSLHTPAAYASRTFQNQKSQCHTFMR